MLSKMELTIILLIRKLPKICCQNNEFIEAKFVHGSLVTSVVELKLAHDQNRGNYRH